MRVVVVNQSRVSVSEGLNAIGLDSTEAKGREMRGLILSLIFMYVARRSSSLLVHELRHSLYTAHIMQT